MKKIYLYLITLDNQIKYFVSSEEHTYNMYHAKMFRTRGAAQKVADKSNTMWKVGVTYIPQSALGLLKNDFQTNQT